MICLFIQMMMGHAIADFGLQSQQMARGKNRNVPSEHVPPGQTLQICWPYYLASHGLIHGAMVMIVTGNVVLGLAESIMHCAIDFGKCDNHYGIHEDQIMHVICKLLWCWIAKHNV